MQSLMKEQQERLATEMVKFLDKELGGTEEEKMFESYNASIKASIKPGEKYEQLILAAEICHGEVSKIGSSSQVKMMTDEGAVDIMREDGCFMVNREMLNNAEEAQVFVGEGAAHGRGESRVKGQIQCLSLAPRPNTCIRFNLCGI